MSVIPRGLCLSFAGAGFLGVYQIGVAKYLQQNSVPISKVGGCSSGSMVSCMLLDEFPAKKMRSKFQLILEIVRKSYIGAFSPKFNVEYILKDELMPDLSDQVLERVNGRLHISVTNLAKKNIIINNFDTKEDLIDAIACSSFIPAFSGYRIPKLKGARYVDGGFSVNLPTICQDTITISSFSGRNKDISPFDPKIGGYPSFDLGGEDVSLTPSNIKRLMHAGFLTKDSMYDFYENQGYEDARLYFETERKIEGLVT